MNKFLRSKLMIIVLAFLLVIISRVDAEQGDDLFIEKVLDEPAQIDFTDITLEEAFSRLSQATGIKFDLEHSWQAVDQLPYGKLTQISAKLQGLPWRQALNELLRSLALRFQVGRDRIYIYGTDELIRQPGRLNLLELDALVRLQSTSLSESTPEIIKQLRHVTRINYGLIVNSHRQKEVDKKTAKKALSSEPQPAHKVLNWYSNLALRKPHSDSTWYLAADAANSNSKHVDIVILTFAELMDIKFARRINIEFRNQPAQAILQELADRAGVGITFEPGCVALLEPELRDNCSLVMRGGTIKNALEALMGLTGLAYTVDAAGIHIAASETLRAMANAPQQISPPRSPLACTLTRQLPGTDLEAMIMIREQQLEEAGLLETYRKLQEDHFQKFVRFLNTYEQTESAK